MKRSHNRHLTPELVARIVSQEREFIALLDESIQKSTHLPRNSANTLRRVQEMLREDITKLERTLPRPTDGMPA